MQDSSIVIYNGPISFDYKPYHLSWHDSSSYDGAGMYEEPLSSTEDASYDDTYYLTYEEVDDYPSRPWYKNRGTNQDHNRGNEMPHGISGTCLGDYTCYFGCYWEENEVYPEEGYGSSFEKEENCGDEQWNCFNYNDYVQPDYSENQWLGYGGLDFGGGSMGDDSDDFEYRYSSSCDNWEEMMTLYGRIFGH